MEANSFKSNKLKKTVEFRFQVSISQATIRRLNMNRLIEKIKSFCNRNKILTICPYCKKEQWVKKNLKYDEEVKCKNCGHWSGVEND